MSEYTKGLTAEQLIEHIANDYVELSHEKVFVQRNDFISICQEWLIQQSLSETCIKQKDYKYEADDGPLTKDQIKQLKETLISQSDVTHPKQRTGNCLLTGVCASEGHKIHWKAEHDKLKAKQWVGLTDEEKTAIYEEEYSFGYELIEKTEAKLKAKNERLEKNT